MVLAITNPLRWRSTPRPQTLNPNPQTLNPKLYTLNPETLNPKP